MMYGLKIQKLFLNLLKIHYKDFKLNTKCYTNKEIQSLVQLLSITKIMGVFFYKATKLF